MRLIRQNRGKKGLLCLLMLTLSLSAAPRWKLPFSRSKFDIRDFIADTLLITLPVDTAFIAGETNLTIVDERWPSGRLLGIQSTRKWKYIPVDQLLMLNRDLSLAARDYCRRDSLRTSGTLYIKKLVYWKDDSPFFNPGRKLNAYCLLTDGVGQVMSDWLWEYTLKLKKKQKDSTIIAEMMNRWLIEQTEAIRRENFHEQIYPYLYRRQMMSWADYILLTDGYAVNVHLTLDFPADREKAWIRGSPGMFYRRGRYHQSLAIGGKDQQWYARLNSSWIRRLNLTLRFGVNNFDHSHYEHLDIWNLFLFNLSVNAALEYRPVYLKGFFGGLGLHTALNVLPEVIGRVEPGLLFTMGWILP